MLPAINREETGKELASAAVEEGDLRGTEGILLVDDEELVLRLEVKLLESYGYKVIAENNPERALQIFEESPDLFDLVITDMTMPNMTGIELVKKLKQIRADVKTIVCTGYSENMNSEKAEELGIQGFLAKPATRLEFAGKVRAILDNR